MRQDKYLIVGSGPLAVEWLSEHEHLLGSWSVCPINTAWKIVGLERTVHWFHSKDFFASASVVPQGVVAADFCKKAVTDCLSFPFHYIYPGEDEMGTMALNAMSHVLNLALAQERKIKTAVACSNFVYGYGKTHWYGRGPDVERLGRPDPLRSGEKNLLAWLSRVMGAYAAAGCHIYNVGPFSRGTLLPFEQVSLESL